MQAGSRVARRAGCGRSVFVRSLQTYMDSKRIVISTFGSFGDIHPYVAIALELKARGHRPLIATSEVYREKMDAVGIDFHPVRPDVPSYEQPEELAALIEQGMSQKHGPDVIANFILLALPRNSCRHRCSGGRRGFAVHASAAVCRHVGRARNEICPGFRVCLHRARFCLSMIRLCRHSGRGCTIS